MKKFYILFIALMGLSYLQAQDSPCDCGDMASSNLCVGGVYADQNAALAASNPYTLGTPLTFSTNGESYEFCYKYTPGTNVTTIGFVNYVNVGGGCSFSRSNWTAYEAGCNNPITGSTGGLGNNTAEFAVTPGVEYSFCVTMTADGACPGGTINNIENFIYEITSAPQGGGPCNTDAGTYTIDIDGATQTGLSHTVAEGETINITYNNDGTLPSPSGSDPVGIGYDIFDCAPTFDPNTELPQDDPCYLGSGFDLSNNINDSNSGDNSSSVPGKTELWFLPTTMDDMQKISTGGSDDARGPDTDGDGCWASSNAIHVTYTTVVAPPGDCGSCSTADCPVAHITDFADRALGYSGGPSSDCNTLPAPASNTSYITYHTVTADANGAIGLAQQIEVFPQGCETRSVVLRPANDACNAGPDVTNNAGPDVTNNAGFGSGFNPEWYGLVPGASYIVVLTTVLSSGCTYTKGCLVWYDIPNPPLPPANPAGPCEMQDGNIETCDCEFKDSGTETANYADNEDFTYTICPSPNDGSRKVRIDITSLGLQDLGDILSVYDGVDTFAQRVERLTAGAGNVPNNTAPTYNIDATTGNTNGCLTVHFKSNSSGNGIGWLADVSCFSLCTDPVADESTGTVKICVGESVTLDASGSTANDANGITIYDWDFDDGNTETSTASPSHTFNTPGRYTPSLIVTNDGGCVSTNAITTEILVGTVPNFDGMTGATYCVNDNLTIDGIVTWPIVTDIPVPDAMTVQPIPETAGTATQTIDISGYAIGQKITNANEVLSVCINMEHSAIDDLIMTLTSPTGESVKFHNRGGQAVALGIPTMASAALEGLCGENPGTQGQGVGWDYCFKMGAAETLVDHALANWNTPYSCYTAPAGDYAPLDPYSNFVGADINGSWVLTIEDVFPNDDGTVFTWDLNLDPGLLPANATIQPTLTIQSWSPANGADITAGSNGQTVSITASDVANTDYTYSVTDDFGCTFDTIISLTINPLDDATFNYSKSSYCKIEPNETPTKTDETTNGIFSEPTGGIVFISATTGEIDFASCTSGNYTISYQTNGTCPGLETFEITIVDFLDASFDYPNRFYCQTESDPIATNVVNTGGTFTSDNATALIFSNAQDGTIDLAASTPGTYLITYTTAGTCGATDTFSITLSADGNADFQYASNSYCQTASNPVAQLLGNAGGTYSSPAGIAVDPVTGEIDLTTSTVGGPYTITYATTGSCAKSSSVEISITLIDDASFSFNPSYCVNEVNPSPSNIQVSGGTWTSDIPGLVINASTGEIDLTASTPNTYTVTYTTAGNCSSNSSRQVIIAPIEDASFSFEKIEHCQNDPNIVPNSVSLPGGTWSEPVGNVSLDPSTGEIDFGKSNAGTFVIYYTTNGTCFSVDSFTIIIHAPAIAEFISTTVSNKSEDAIDLVTLLTPNATIGGLWSGDYVLNALFTPTDLSKGVYPVTYTVQNGTCLDEYTENINIISDEPPYLPNVFTPNNDGINDYFFPVGTFEGTTEYELKVFNRWGEKVFKSNNPLEYWNGRKQSGAIVISGMYTYHLSFLDSNNEKQIRVGAVLLLN